MISFKLTVGLGMEGRGSNEPDSRQTQVLIELLGDVAGAVIRQKHPSILHRHIRHVGEVYRLLPRILQGPTTHVCPKIPAQDESAAVVHHHLQVIPAPIGDPPMTAITRPELLDTSCLPPALFTRLKTT